LLPDFSGDGDFVTAIYGILDPRDGSFIHTNCGHHPIFYLRAGGETEKIKLGGPALGIFKTPNYRNFKTSLNPGDTLIILTDGIIESQNQRGETFGTRQIIKSMGTIKDQSAQTMTSKLIQTAIAFCENDSFQDDVTLLVIKRVL